MKNSEWWTSEQAEASWGSDFTNLALIEMMILQHLPDWYYSFFYFPKHFNRQCHYVLHKHCTIQCVALSSEHSSDFARASKIILFIYCCTIKWTSFRFCDSIKDYPVYLLLHYQVNLLQILWQHQRLSCLFIFVWEIKSEANKLILQFLRGPLVEMHTRGWGSGGQIFGWF